MCYQLFEYQLNSISVHRYIQRKVNEDHGDTVSVFVGASSHSDQGD